MASKRKRVLTIEKKYKIIKDLKSGESATKLSRNIDLTDASIDRKSLTNLKNKNIDDVFQWFRQQRDKGISIYGHMLREKTYIEFNDRLKGNPLRDRFKACNDWLIKFKTCHALIWKALPQTLVSHYERLTPDRKINKECITILFCANAIGCHQLSILIIGKSKHPHYFKHVNMSAMPIKEHQLKNSHKKRAILLVDNARYNIPNQKEEFTKYMFLLPNITSLMQSLDQGVIELTNEWSNIKSITLKRAWKKLLMREIEEINKQEKTVEANIEEIVTTLDRIPECDSDDVMQWFQCDKDNSNNEDNINFTQTEAVNESNDEDMSSYIEVFESFEKGLRWFEAQRECNSTQLVTIKNFYCTKD
ncbi:tigger transposable element-derived protein 2-like [Apis dorsata]|uniref:tigger transposable element-derived protein 2-like n=1 Tax=Apis dorsata TaxID=7462 RepID=UPI0003DF6F49|nr:tigger transposable element-derived protein 2-like [Apis dorsata]